MIQKVMRYQDDIVETAGKSIEMLARFNISAD